MKRFKLKLSAAKDKSLNIGINDLERSKRDYHNATVSGIKFDEVAVNVMTQLGPNLKTLELLNVTVNSLTSDFFAPLVNLEHLKLESCKFRRYQVLRTVNDRDLPMVKSIVLDKSSFSVSVSSVFTFSFLHIFVLFAVAHLLPKYSSRKVAFAE